MFESNPRHRFARLLAVLLGVLLMWPQLPGPAAETPEFGELREVDDSETESANLEPCCTTTSRLDSGRGVHRLATVAQRDPHIAPSHARLERQRGPPSFE